MSRSNIKRAMAKVNAEIVANTDRSNKFSVGMAYEGWSGGYLSALQDVLLALDGVQPNTRDYWSDFRVRRRPIPESRPSDDCTPANPA